MACRREITEAEMGKEKNYSFFYLMVDAYLRNGSEDSLGCIGYFLEDNNISYGDNELIDSCVHRAILDGDAALIEVFVVNGLNLFGIPFRFFAEAFKMEKHEMCEKLWDLFLPELDFKKIKIENIKKKLDYKPITIEGMLASASLPCKYKTTKERIVNSLKSENIRTVTDLVSHEEADLLRVPNFGVKCMLVLKLALDSHGLKLGKLT